VSPLAASTAHTLTITGVKDLAGNTLAGTTNVGFTTAAGLDFQRPTAPTTVPTNGATNVSKTPTLTVNFSERVSARTVETSSFSLVQSSNSAPVACTIAVAPDLLSATLTPTAPLAGSTQYTFNATSGITDLAGNTLIGVAPSFTTVP